MKTEDGGGSNMPLAGCSSQTTLVNNLRRKAVFLPVITQRIKLKVLHLNLLEFMLSIPPNLVIAP
jgi:hypothetical protein